MARFAIIVSTGANTYFIEGPVKPRVFGSVDECEAWILEQVPPPPSHYRFDVWDCENARTVPRPSADYASRAISLRLELAELLEANGQSYIIVYSHGEGGGKVDGSIEGTGAELVGLLKTAKSSVPDLKKVLSQAAHG